MAAKAEPTPAGNAFSSTLLAGCSMAGAGGVVALVSEGARSVLAASVTNSGPGIAGAYVTAAGNLGAAGCAGSAAIARPGGSGIGAPACGPGMATEGIGVTAAA